MIRKLGMIVHDDNFNSWKAEVKECYEFKDAWATNTASISSVTATWQEAISNINCDKRRQAQRHLPAFSALGRLRLKNYKLKATKWVHSGTQRCIKGGSEEITINSGDFYVWIRHGLGCKDLGETITRICLRPFTHTASPHLESILGWADSLVSKAFITMTTSRTHTKQPWWGRKGERGEWVHGTHWLASLVNQWAATVPVSYSPWKSTVESIWGSTKCWLPDYTASYSSMWIYFCQF